MTTTTSRFLIGGTALTVALALAGCGAASSSGTGAASTSGTKAPAALKAVGTNIAVDTSQVANEVQTVQVAVGLFNKTKSQADLNQVAQSAQSAHDALTNDKTAIATDSSGTIGTDLFTAVNELKNSMAALGTYTGNPNAATLASFTTQYQTGVADWNTAVTALYAGKAGTPPTI